MATVTGGSRGLRLLIGTAAAVIALAGLKAAAQIAGPAFLALTLTIGVNPLRSWLRRRGAGTWLVVALPLVVVFLVLILLVGSLVWSVVRLVDVLPAYTAQYESLLKFVTERVHSLGITPDQVKDVIGKLDPNQIIPVLQGFLSGLLSVGTMVVLVTLILFGMNVDAPFLQDAVRALAPGRPHLVAALGEFSRGTVRYLVVTTVFGLIVAVFDGIALWILGVPLPLLWALLAFITNFVPNIGFFIGLVPPALLALLSSGWVTMVWVIVIYCVLNFVIQSVIQPKFTGESAGLSMTITILSLLVWTYVLGALGAILAVPLSALARALLIDADPETSWASPLVTGPAVRT
ncbi:AI-2E family transporter [Sinosporangium siamense]|uniref:AI-2E family transporter n=1 Tax=Sinosporangium siamense TaxID=1367973 RepID=A0A919RNZ3_9ACTN|nr:AI-2E family transporter [Sinosporangium siamense]GII97198.1 AI-2E family transporter [Sinosporangium siamense]